MRAIPFFNRPKQWVTFVLCTTGLIFVLSGCRKENEETYFNKTGTDTTAVDTTYVSYTKDIDTIFKAKCVSCHVGGTSGNCDLDTYDHTIAYIYSHQPQTKLYDYVNTVTPHQGVNMESQELKKLSKWVQNPAP
jgi:hypothetical protein